MKLIVCIDERGGMLFNNRRQSKDRILLADMKSIIGSETLFCLPFSDKMLTEADIPHTSSETPFELAAHNDYCFIESISVKKHLEKLDEILIYKWNRHYPADLYFEINPELLGFQKIEVYEFKGSSHEKITRERYIK